VTEYTVGQVIEQMRFAGFVVEKIVGSGVQGTSNTAKELFVNRLVRPVVWLVLAAVGSHHHLDSTVFFLARKEG
jgi:hypothetical protein